MTNDTCSICLEPLLHYSNGSLVPIGASLCGHCFHCDCFWRWDEAKRRQDWRRGLASRGCPCPVCNVHVDEFIKLFISGDSSENERLRKELKELKQRLAKELKELEKTRKELKVLEQSHAKQDDEAPQTSRGMLDSSRRTLEKDIKDLCETVSTLLNSPKSEAKLKKYSAKNAERAKSPYRRHDSCPLDTSSSFPEINTPRDLDNLCLHSSISMPPEAENRRRSRRRGGRLDESRTESPRRRLDDVPHRSSPNRGELSRRRSFRRRPNPESSRRISRPDPPTPEGGWSSNERSSSFMDSFSAPRFLSSARGGGEDDAAPSCRPPTSDDSIVEEGANAPTPNNRRTPLVNFMGDRKSVV